MLSAVHDGCRVPTAIHSSNVNDDDRKNGFPYCLEGVGAHARIYHARNEHRLETVRHFNWNCRFFLKRFRQIGNFQVYSWRLFFHSLWMKSQEKWTNKSLSCGELWLQSDEELVQSVCAGGRYDWDVSSIEIKLGEIIRMTILRVFLLRNWCKDIGKGHVIPTMFGCFVVPNRNRQQTSVGFWCVEGVHTAYMEWYVSPKP